MSGGRSLWARIVVAQLAIALLLAISLPLVTSRTINAISDDLTASFLGTAARRAAAQPPAARPDDGSSAVAIYQVRDGRATRLAGPAIDDIAVLPPLPTGATLYHGRHSDFYVLPAGEPGSAIVAAQDRRQPAALLDDITSLFVRRFSLIVPVVLLLSTMASLIAVRTAMRPLRVAAHDASQRDPADLKVRLDERRVPGEIAPLIRAANAAFDRLEQAYENERTFAATIVHELRTCLSTILLRTELLGPGRIRSALEDAAQRAAGVVNQMLELQSISTASASRIVCLEEVAEQVRVELLPLIERSGRTMAVEVNGPANLIHLPAHLAHVALRNLVQNANVHSLVGGPITITCDNWAGTLGVRDTGPGIAVRQDADGRLIYSRADGMPSAGSGLGLAIVHRLMAIVDGQLEYARTPEGGTLATLRFGDRLIL